MKPALLVIDVQKEFVDATPTIAQTLGRAIDYINAGIALFREKGLPVVCIQHVNEKKGLVPGAEGFDVPEQLAILPADLHIRKTYGNSFTRTGLASELAKLGVDTVIVTGFSAERCVLSTYRGALDLDLTPIILRGALGSDDADRLRFVEEISDIVSLGALKKALA
jgi:nicotinamidase-related amidase